MPNEFLSEAIKAEVPRGLRDVVGPEEMLKMSNIFTGGTIQSINLHKKVNELIGKKITVKEVKVDDEEDMTLKSIKRW